MEIVAKTLGGILCIVAGAHIGLRIMMYLSLGFLAGFSSWTANRSFFHGVSSRFAVFTTPETAVVITYFILTVLPLVTVIFLGRIALVKLQISKDSPGKVADKVLGGGYSLAAYLCILVMV